AGRVLPAVRRAARPGAGLRGGAGQGRGAAVRARDGPGATTPRGRHTRARLPVGGDSRPRPGGIGGPGMTITDVVVTPIAFPDPPLLNASGVHQPWALRTIVELRCGDELVGLGETYGDAPHLELVRKAAAAVVGVDPYDLADLGRRVAGAVGGVDVPDLHGL